MSLRINHNVAALNAHRNLTLTTRSLAGSMEKLSSGFRINRASDDPAGLVISEQFRAQIAGLNRAISNSEGSINMIQTAEGALNEINNLLVSMRELAIHAANEGFNDTNQLAADQAEIQNSIATIDRIAANTQFGTKQLLDGTKDNIATITSANQSNVTIVESNLTTGNHSITATKVTDSTATLNTTSFGIALKGTGSPVELTDGIHNIDVLQASAGAEKITSQIKMQDAWNNNLVLGSVGSAAYIESVAVLATVTASNDGTYSVTLDFQDSDGTLAGQQIISADLAEDDTLSMQVDKWNAAIRNNSFLSGKIEAATADCDADNRSKLVFKAVDKGAQYSINFLSMATSSGTGTNVFTLGAARSNRGISSDRLKFQVTTVKNAAVTKNIDISTTDESGVSNGQKEYTSINALVSDISRALKIATTGLGFGTVQGTVGNVDVQETEPGSNRLKFFTYDEGSDYSIKFLGNGTATEEAQYILGLTTDTVALTGTDALVAFDNYTNTLSSVKYASTYDTTLYDSAAGTTGRASIDITVNTAANGIDIGNMLLDVSAAQYDVRLDAGPATSATAGEDAIIYNSDRTESIKLRYGLSSTGGTETIYDTDQSLVFQIGGNVGQTAKIGLRNMAASALGKNIAGNMYANLSQIDVTTVQGAQDSQSVIDAAIDDVSTMRGTLGSFQKNTLESNLSNLRIASQNLVASESDIRDTDMAREMSEFVKYQILLQAGTSMLAQANQVPQVVLSLFG